MSSHPAEDAIRNFWEAREADHGTRRVGAIRGAQRDRALVDAVIDELVRSGLDRACIHSNQPLSLPGSYQDTSRPWDVVVIEEGMPVAAIEVVAAVRPGIQHNLRNRMDDILASGANVFRAYGQSSVRELKPALGQLFMLEDCPETTTPVRQHPNALTISESPSPPRSYEGKLQDFFQRLIGDGMYDAVCYLMSQAPPNLAIREPDPEMGFTTFARAMVDRIAEAREARQQRNISAAELGRMLAGRDDVVEVVSALSSTEAGRLAVDLDVIRRRRQTVAELRELVLNPATTEADIQKIIGRKYWVFGGQYTGVLERRDGIPLDQHDIPLICADRSIHVIELKRPGHKLVRVHRNHLIVSNEVHEAVGQCMNYLRGLDELGATLQTYQRNELNLDYDYRRARGTVVIGHPELAATEAVIREQVEQTIRSYNAHLSRVQVLTFAELVDSAERALQFEAEDRADV